MLLWEAMKAVREYEAEQVAGCINPAGYMEVSAYLTDIWQTGAEDYGAHMYVRRFKEVQ